MAVVAAASAAAAEAMAAAGEGTAPQAMAQAGSEVGRESLPHEAGGEKGKERIAKGCFAWLPDPRLLHASLDAAISAHGDAYVQVIK